MIRTASLALPRHRAPLGDILARWIGVARQRRALAGLDETRLDDLGLSREEAEREAGRPFWDAPDSWRL